MNSKVKNIKKFISIIIMITMFIIICASTKVEAASFSITSGISSITVGNSYTISISASGLTGRFDITHSSNVSVNVDSVWVENGVADSTIRVTTTDTGTATVTVTPVNVADVNTEEDVSLSPDTDTVTVNAKSSNNNNNNSSSGGNSSGSSSSSSGQSTPSFTEVNETVYATSSVNVRSSYSTSSSVVGSLDAGDSVTRTGRGSNGWSRVSYNGQTAYISSSYLTTEKPEESNNKNLESLTLGDGLELTPVFSSDVTEYTLTVGADATSIDINATAEDENAKVEVTGNDNLLMGENTIEIKVTAEDGTERTYTITVTKGEAGETVVNGIGLSELSVEGYTLSPEFSSNVYEYTLDVPDTSVTNLTINAKSNLETAVIEIAGNNELVLGENVITILVKSENEDGEAETVTYQIIANIHEPEKTQIIAGIDDEDLFLYGGIALAVLIILIIVIIVVVRRRRNKEDEDYGTYYGGFSSLNRDTDNTVNQDDVEATDRDSRLREINNDFNTTTEIQPEQTRKQEPELNEREQTRKSVIEENFGADIKPDYYEENTQRRKKGKHF